MWFNIVVANHGGAAAIVGLNPLITYLRSLLSLCGHEVTAASNPSPRSINLYLEYFIGGRIGPKKIS